MLFASTRITANAAHELASTAAAALKQHMETCDRRQDFINTELREIKSTQTKNAETAAGERKKIADDLQSLKTRALWYLITLFTGIIGTALAQSIHFKVTLQ